MEDSAENLLKELHLYGFSTEEYNNKIKEFIKNGYKVRIQRLLKVPGTINFSAPLNEMQDNFLMYACRYLDKDFIRYLLQDEEINKHLRYKNRFNHDILHLLFERRLDSIVSDLLKKDCFFENLQEYSFVFFHAARANDLNLVDFFVKSKKFDINTIDEYGQNGFFYALLNENFPMIKILEKDSEIKFSYLIFMERKKKHKSFRYLLNCYDFSKSIESLEEAAKKYSWNGYIMECFFEYKECIKGKTSWFKDDLSKQFIRAVARKCKESIEFLCWVIQDKYHEKNFFPMILGSLFHALRTGKTEIFVQLYNLLEKLEDNIPKYFKELQGFNTLETYKNEENESLVSLAIDSENYEALRSLKLKGYKEEDFIDVNSVFYKAMQDYSNPLKSKIANFLNRKLLGLKREKSKQTYEIIDGVELASEQFYEDNQITPKGYALVCNLLNIKLLERCSKSFHGLYFYDIKNEESFESFLSAVKVVMKAKDGNAISYCLKNETPIGLRIEKEDSLLNFIIIKNIGMPKEKLDEIVLFLKDNVLKDRKFIGKYKIFVGESISQSFNHMHDFFAIRDCWLMEEMARIDSQSFIKYLQNNFLIKDEQANGEMQFSIPYQFAKYTECPYVFQSYLKFLPEEYQKNLLSLYLNEANFIGGSFTPELVLDSQHDKDSGRMIYKNNEILIFSQEIQEHIFKRSFMQRDALIEMLKVYSPGELTLDKSANITAKNYFDRLYLVQKLELSSRAECSNLFYMAIHPSRVDFTGMLFGESFIKEPKRMIPLSIATPVLRKKRIKVT